MSLKPDEAEPEPIQTGPDTFQEPDVISVGPPSSWRVVSRFCPAGQHDMVKDESETEFEAEKCTRCPYGVLRSKKPDPSS